MGIIIIIIKGIWFKSLFKREWEIIREDFMRYENEIVFIFGGIVKKLM